MPASNRAPIVVPTPLASWSEDMKHTFNYFVMESTDDSYASLIQSESFPPRTEAEFYLLREQYRTRVRRTTELVKRIVPPEGRVLDIAGSHGQLAIPLAEAGLRVTLNDLRPDPIAFFKLVYTGRNIETRVGNAFELTFDEPFDLVLATEIIEHVAHPDRFLKRCASLVRSGGYVLVTTPNGNWLRSKMPRFSNFSEDQLTLFEAGQFKPDADGHIFALQRDEIFSICKEAQLRVELIEYMTPMVRIARLPLGKVICKLPLLDRLLNSRVMFLAHRV